MSHGCMLAPVGLAWSALSGRGFAHLGIFNGKRHHGAWAVPNMNDSKCEFFLAAKEYGRYPDEVGRIGQGTRNIRQ